MLLPHMRTLKRLLPHMRTPYTEVETNAAAEAHEAEGVETPLLLHIYAALSLPLKFKTLLLPMMNETAAAASSTSLMSRVLLLLKNRRCRVCR